MSKKISIITINFNNLEGLKKTFESVFLQTFQDFEYIVIDGGSTDGSKEFIEKNQDKITYWISEKDNGVYHAMNKGILKSTGEYLNFMNSGDWFYENNTLEKVFSQIHDEDIVYGNTLLIYTNGNKQLNPPKDLSFDFMMNRDLNHQAMFFKIRLFKNSFLYNEKFKICADWEFLVYNLIIKNASYKKIETIICYYDTNGVSSNPETHQLYLSERKMVKEKYFNFLIKSPLLEHLTEKRKLDIDCISRNKSVYKILRFFINILLLFTNKKKMY